MRLVAFALIISHLTVTAIGHGYLAEPPGRASAWRYGFDTPVDYDDNECFCGGFSYQYSQLGGKCGLCGDPWDQDPRVHEVGGTYATGTIVRHYTQGQVVTTTANVTANHLGHFEYKICANNDATVEATQDCLDLAPLYAVDHDDWHLNIGSTIGIVNFDLQLPADLTCSQCVLQWRYVTANTWGTCENGTEAVGCGPQEEFRACADVSISAANLDESRSSSPKKVVQHEQLASRTTTTQSEKLVPHKSRGPQHAKITHLEHPSVQNLGHGKEPKLELEYVSHEDVLSDKDSVTNDDNMKEFKFEGGRMAINEKRPESGPESGPEVEKERELEKALNAEEDGEVSAKAQFNGFENTNYDSQSASEELQSQEDSRLGEKSESMAKLTEGENSKEYTDKESGSYTNLGAQQQRTLKFIEEMAIALKSNSEKRSRQEQEIDERPNSETKKNFEDDDAHVDVEEEEYDSDSDSESEEDDE